MKKLQTKKQLDENLKTIITDDKVSSLSIAEEGHGAKVDGKLIVTDGLEVEGTVGNLAIKILNAVDTINTSDDLTINVGGDITLDADGSSIFLKDGGTTFGFLDSSAGLKLYENAGASTDDFLAITVAAEGATTIETTDASGTDASLVIKADGDLALNSTTGVFKAFKGLVEFSAADSAYAGMILGYTVIGDNATPASYDVLASMEPVHDDLKVSFVFPPSGKVEIFASIYVQTDSARPLTFGLSTASKTDGYASLGAKYEQHTIIPDETDGIQHTHRWYITGTAGASEELWFAAGCTHTGRYDLFWGGDSSSVADSSHPMEYQPFVMKATALPATVYTG